MFYGYADVSYSVGEVLSVDDLCISYRYSIAHHKKPRHHITKVSYVYLSPIY